MAEQKTDGIALAGGEGQAAGGEAGNVRRLGDAGYAAAQGGFQAAEAFGIVPRLGEQDAPRVQPQPGDAGGVGVLGGADPEDRGFGFFLRRQMKNNEGEMGETAGRAAQLMHRGTGQASRQGGGWAGKRIW